MDGDAQFDDPQLAERYRNLSEELRCLVCQNQTIADSDAGLAKDLRKQIREMLLDGASDEEITQYMVSRYGDFVLYRPPVKATTWLLWLGPFLLLVLAGFILIRAVRMQAARADDADDEEAE
ncbi:MAG: cytochrome c-type biogenesis protein CcmH [Gammaproteobacteria bacterium]|nr:cytochrome c-type biogenesis protein CcmH [Gammaproteobacteria bacterium]